MMQTLKTNRQITYNTFGGRSIVLPKGAKVEKNDRSFSGYFISPDNFDKNSMDYHDATHYGFIVQKEDVEM